VHLYVANSPNVQMNYVANKTAFMCGKFSKCTDELSGY